MKKKQSYFLQNIYSRCHNVKVLAVLIIAEQEALYSLYHFYIVSILKHFAKFLGKHLRCGSILEKLQGGARLYKHRTPSQVSPWLFYKQPFFRISLGGCWFLSCIYSNVFRGFLGIQLPAKQVVLERL